MNLSSRHRSFFDQPNWRTVSRFRQFCVGVHRADKWRELLSYLRWEVNHRVGAFHKSRYLRFTDHQPMLLTDSSPIPLAFSVGPSARAQRSALPWRMLLSRTGREQWGCLFSDELGLYVSRDSGQSATCCYVFAHPIQSLFQSAAGHLYVCNRGTLFRSTDGGNSFQDVMHFSSPDSYFLFNNGMTELPDGRLLIGEYGVVEQANQRCQNLAYVYYSTDRGENWQRTDFLIRDGVNKHVHLVKYSLHLNAIALTDGDNKKQVWLNRSLTNIDRVADRNGAGWQRLNQSHYQTGGYLSMVSVNGTVLFGSDYLGGTNFLLATTDGPRFERKIVPDPYRRSPVVNMVTRRTRSGTAEIWAVLHNSIASTTRCLLMHSADAGTTWTRVMDYDGTRHEINLVSSAQGCVEQLYVAIITKQNTRFSHAVFAIVDE